MNESTTPRRRTARRAGVAGLLGAGAITGGILGESLRRERRDQRQPHHDQPATSSTSTSTAPSRTSTPGARHRGPRGAGEAGHRHQRDQGAGRRGRRPSAAARPAR